MIIIISLFACFVFLEYLNNSRTFGLGVNPIIIFIFHLFRFGFLFAAMILIWFYSNIFFWALLIILSILLCAGYMHENENKKIKKIIRIYKNLKTLSPQISGDLLLRKTSLNYYKSLGWSDSEINSNIKTLFNNSEDEPKDIKMLAAWLLFFERPDLTNRFRERYNIASRCYEKL